MTIKACTVEIAKRSVCMYVCMYVCMCTYVCVIIRSLSVRMYNY